MVGVYIIFTYNSCILCEDECASFRWTYHSKNNNSSVTSSSMGLFSQISLNRSWNSWSFLFLINSLYKDTLLYWENTQTKTRSIYRLDSMRFCRDKINSALNPLLHAEPPCILFAMERRRALASSPTTFLVVVDWMQWIRFYRLHLMTLTEVLDIWDGCPPNCNV